MEFSAYINPEWLLRYGCFVGDFKPLEINGIGCQVGVEVFGEAGFIY